MAVGFALIDHIHNLIGAGDKAFSASLRERERREGVRDTKQETHITQLMQHRQI